jgi:D-tyrosyl-tRNA(Tyr) deacylase
MNGQHVKLEHVYAALDSAAPGPVAEPLVGAVVQALRDLGARVQTGVFGADMKVSLVNDGPVTIIVDL